MSVCTWCAGAGCPSCHMTGAAANNRVGPMPERADVDDKVVGMVDTPDLAKMIVDAMNARPA